MSNVNGTDSKRDGFRRRRSLLWKTVPCRIGTESGVALVLSITVLAMLVGMAGYFSTNVGLELQASRGQLYGVRARALAEAGLARTIARIREDVRTVRMYDPDFKDINNWPDLLHRRYSTRSIPNEGVWGDAVDDDGDGEIETDQDEIVSVDDKGTPGVLTDDDGYYVIVRDANAMVDINSASYPQHLYMMDDAAADQLINGRSGLPGGAYASIDQIRSVIGQEKYDQLEPKLSHAISIAGSDVVTSGGLVGRYYALNTSTTPYEVEYTDFKGSVVDHGTDVTRSYDVNTFRFTQASHFAFQEDATNAGILIPILPNFDAAGDFAVVWTGYVFIPNRTPITFRIDYNGGARMVVAGQEITTASNWDTNGVDFAESSVTLVPGWHPVLIEYYSTGAPSVTINWDGGYHVLEPDVNISGNDPDIDLNPSGTQVDDVRMPMSSFGFKAGGYYEISSTGVARDRAGKVLAERTVTAFVRLWDYVHESTVEDFSAPGAARSFVNFDDVCPIGALGEATFWSLEFDVAGLRTYDTMYNSLKLGYWEDFEVIDPAEFEEPDPTYPYADSSTLAASWVPRGTTTFALQDIDGDLDNELVITNVIDDLVEGVDWVGVGGSHNNPRPEFTFQNAWIRFEEDDGRSGSEHENFEDQVDIPNTVRATD